MEFKKDKNSLFLEGTTKKGNTISFVPVPIDSLIIYNEDNANALAYRDQGTKYFVDIPKPTRLVLYSNFEFTTKMIDELEKSRIIAVIERCNNRQIIAYALFAFDFDKLKKVLFDLAQKFEL